MKPYKKASRKWLNPAGHYDTGAIQWYVEQNGDGLFIESGLSIWDCGKKITLNFSIYNEKDIQARADKINLLIKELEAMRTALGEAYTNINWQMDSYLSTLEEIEE